MSGIGPTAEMDDHALLGFDPSVLVAKFVRLVKKVLSRPLGVIPSEARDLFGSA